MSDELLNEWARSHQDKHGHPPLIIGHEYEYVGEWVRLVEASESRIQVVVATRFEQRTTCDKEELTWKANG